MPTGLTSRPIAQSEERPPDTRKVAGSIPARPITRRPVAQRTEHRTSNPGVESSNLSGSIYKIIAIDYISWLTRGGCWSPDRAHNPVHAGSIPVPAMKARSSTDRAPDYGSGGCGFDSCRVYHEVKGFSSAGSERLPYKQEVVGSTPTTPTMRERSFSPLPGGDIPVGATQEDQRLMLSRECLEMYTSVYDPLRALGFKPRSYKTRDVSKLALAVARPLRRLPDLRTSLNFSRESVAQLGRALVSKTRGWRFDSSRACTAPVVYGLRSRPFKPGNRVRLPAGVSGRVAPMVERMAEDHRVGGSTPPSSTWGRSSTGRAPALQAGGCGFDSRRFHTYDAVAETVRQGPAKPRTPVQVRAASLDKSGAGVAQLEEQLICNQQVGGSIPSASLGGLALASIAGCNPVVSDCAGSTPAPPTVAVAQW